MSPTKLYTMKCINLYLMTVKVFLYKGERSFLFGFARKRG